MAIEAIHANHDEVTLPSEPMATRHGDREISVVSSDRFMVSDQLGDALPGTAYGFYASDTRFLSKYLLTLNGQRPKPLAARNAGHDVALFYATNPALDGVDPGTIGLVRERRVDGALHDELVLANHSGRPVSLVLGLELQADFLDIFEVRSFAYAHVGELSFAPDGEAHFAFSIHRDGVLQRSSITFSIPPELEDTTAKFRLHLQPGEEWRLAVTIHAEQRTMEHQPVVDMISTNGTTLEHAAAWDMPQLETDDVDLRLAYRRAIEDLQALKLTTADGHALPAAGLPWYVAVFGRDSLITAYETLLLGPELALGTLRALATYQATAWDDFRDAEPGKIPHEIRNGRLAWLGRVPHARYYGTVDATPLWLSLLSETFRWTGDLALVQSLLPTVEAALQWIDRYGDLDGDGLVEYQKRSPGGLENQGWKDSWDSIRFADGRLAEGPIALVEVQGYVYDAKLRVAELFETLGDGERAKALRTQAEALQRSFDQAFWLPDEGYYALALDGRKQPVDSVTSNPGHALWSGIVPEHRAGAVAERLLSQEMFSGWGIRTMSSRMGGYNPLSYHCGSVWPHDTALIAAGLARYGYGEAALQALRGLLDASAGFAQHRLPELFSGYARREGGFPVPYPDANAPQAWAAGSVILALQTIMGITPANHQSAIPLSGSPTCRLCRS